MKVYNNTINVSYRSNGINGYCIKYADGGYNKGLKITGIPLSRPPFSGTTNDFDFAIEMWNNRGGIEIYNNISNGSFDFGGQDNNDSGGYGFEMKVYGNTIGWDSFQAHEQMGLDIESSHSGGTYIYNNHFKNLKYPIKGYQGFANGGTGSDAVSDLYIYYNLFEGIDGEYGFYLFPIGDYINSYNNINISNNTFYSNSGSPKSAIAIYFGGNASNIKIYNNIIVGFTNGSPIVAGTRPGCTLTNLDIQNNIFYNNSNNNAVYFMNPVSSKTVLNNQVANPLFISSTDFHLQSGSPAIGKGLKIAGLTTDFEGKAVNDPPSIGAIESGKGEVAPTATAPTPIYQGSVIENATPSVLVMTYDLSLSNVVPSSSSFSVKVNSGSRTISSVTLSGTKVSLKLATPVINGDVVTVAYTKPSSNPLQTSEGGQAASFSSTAVTNNVIPTKEASPADAPITMKISSNPVHHILHVSFSYIGTPVSPEVLRILDLSGKLFIEKVLTTGVTRIWFPISLNSGVYNVVVLSGGVQMALQKIIVY